MGLLDNISSGKTPKPPIIMIYGQPGVGKSTFAAHAPKPFFIDTEDGLNEIDCQKLLAPEYNRVRDILLAIMDEKHDFQTLVIDSISATERMLFSYICEKFGVSNILDVKGGFGKGYKEYTNAWQEIFDILRQIRDTRNMNIILVGHCTENTVFSPRIGQYTQYAPRLYERATDILVESTDAVFFATRRVRVIKEDAGFNKKTTRTAEIGGDGGERIILTGNSGQDGPYVGKNRYSLPDELPLDWNAFVQAWQANYTTTENNNTAKEN